MVPRTTETDLCRLLKGEDKGKPRYARMWLKRMVNQVLRGSFECYINAGKEITEIEHVCEVNHNIANPDDSINMNLWALNEEMGYDSHINEKIDVNKLKNFIELPNNDEDIVLEKNVVDLLNNVPPQEESNIMTIDDDEKYEHDVFREGKYIKAIVDASSMNSTDYDDKDVESEEGDVVLTGDGDSKSMCKYATEICIPHSTESGMITGGIKRDVIIPAGSESSDEESG
jgi:hypothetical protein